MAEGQSIPPAWYPDPADSAKLRYWDGENWTEKLIDRASAAAVMPSLFTPPPVEQAALPAPAADPFAPSYASASFGSDTAFVAAPFSTAPPTGGTAAFGPSGFGQPAFQPSPFDSVGYVPLSRGGAFSASDERPTRSGTVAIWLWVLVPLTLLAHLAFPWDAVDGDYTNLLIHGGLVAGYLILSILLAGLDRSALLRRGYSWTPPAVLGAIPPFHILARLVAVGGVLVLLASLLVQGVVAALLVLAYLPDADAADPETVPVDAAPAPSGMAPPFTAEQTAHLLTPEGMAAKLAYDAQGTDLDYQTVECAPLSALDLGTQTTCTATGRVADYSIVVQVLPDNKGVPFTVMSVAPQPH